MGKRYVESMFNKSLPAKYINCYKCISISPFYLTNRDMDSLKQEELLIGRYKEIWKVCHLNRYTFKNFKFLYLHTKLKNS